MRTLLIAAFLVATLTTMVNAQESPKAPPTKKGTPPVIRDHRTPPPIIRDHRLQVDLRTGSYQLAGDSMLINVVNHGGNGKNGPSKMKVDMYRTINGKEQLIATAYADVPVIPMGTHRAVYLRFTQTIANCRLEGKVDYQRAVSESEEGNNGFRATIK